MFFQLSNGDMERIRKVVKKRKSGVLPSNDHILEGYSIFENSQPKIVTHTNTHKKPTHDANTGGKCSWREI
jgi:hypothetical protein